MSMKSMKGKWIKYIPLLGLCLPVSGQAQEEIAQDATSYLAELFGSLATGDNTPFWMTSNRYGIVPLEGNNTYLKAGVFPATFRERIQMGSRTGPGRCNATRQTCVYPSAICRNRI